jgi:methylenetetrahydrofolate dehydrogenase (NADP+)/methenyltetrahydrofolate cyclohydrolase
MTAALIEGKKVAEPIRNNIAESIHQYSIKGNRKPGLAVILVGENSASQIYVSNKLKACEQVGIRSFAYDLAESTTQQELVSLINALNHNDEIDGILVQLPLPAHIKSSVIIESISPEKDVDGFHPYNLGRLAQGNPLLRPCTPYGVIQLLRYYQLPTAGKHAVVVGASNIVGRPMALELLLAKSTVTVCHRFTPRLEPHIRSADIIIVATGVINVIDTEWLTEKQIIIDVGIHRQADGNLRGDIDFAHAKEKVAWITPVPGGVGPMTISILLQNTLAAYTATLA